MRYGMAAEVGGGLQVDRQSPRPGGMPFFIGRVVGDAFVNAGIVDQHVDPPAELFQCGLPDLPLAKRDRRGRRRSGHRRPASNGRRRWWPDRVEQFEGRGADAAAGAGEEDVHRAALSLRAGRSNPWIAALPVKQLEMTAKLPGARRIPWSCG